MKKTFLLNLFMLTTVYGQVSSAQAQSIAYIHASNQLDALVNQSQYHPNNLFDNNPATAWCVSNTKGGQGEKIALMFKLPQTINRIVIVPSPLSGRDIKTIKISDDTNNVKVHLTGNTLDQELSTPLQGNTLTLTIEQVGEVVEKSALGEQVVCLADIKLYQDDHLVSYFSPDQTANLGDKLIGMWQAVPLGSPESHIIFAADGSWVWEHTPLLSGKRTHMSGYYKFVDHRLLMRKANQNNWVDMNFTKHRVAIDHDDLGAPRDDYDMISLNQALGPEVAGEYSNAQF